MASCRTRWLERPGALMVLYVPSPRHKYPDQTPDLTEIYNFESWYA
jgi:hypothetical protein